MKYDEIMEKVIVTDDMRSRILTNISEAVSKNARGNADKNAQINVSENVQAKGSGVSLGNASNNASGRKGKIKPFMRRMSKFAPAIAAAAVLLVCLIIFLPRVISKNTLGDSSTASVSDSAVTTDTCSDVGLWDGIESEVSSDYFDTTDTEAVESIEPEDNTVMTDTASGNDWNYTDIEYISNALSVAWTDDSSIYFGAVNNEMVGNEETVNNEDAAEGYRSLPVYKFDSKTDLDDFESEYGTIFNLDSACAYNDGSGYTFEEVAAGYDDEFFADHSLIMVYKTAGSSSYEFDISEIYCEENTLYIETVQLNNPEIHTDDMAGWLLIAEVNKADIENCSEFIAY